MKIIDGIAIAGDVLSIVSDRVKVFYNKTSLYPCVAAVIVGDDPASHIYVRNKSKKAAEVGIHSKVIKMDSNISKEELLKCIHDLNSDDSVHGILVQLPLPKHINVNDVIDAVDFKKDVDGFSVKNTGMLYTGRDNAKILEPCTPKGCMLLIRSVMKDISGKLAVIVGRSNIVGKPLANMLLNANCTVVMAHSKTVDLAKECVRADILIAAAGCPQMITADFVKKGAIVIDVGINRIETEGKTKLVGDVDFTSVSTVAEAITPVPGGVGPMTIACLMLNVVKAAELSNGIVVDDDMDLLIR